MTWANIGGVIAVELYQLKYFEQVARYESVSRAAKELHVSQPAVSKAVSKLEEELGVSLFDRMGKRIALNDRGAFYLENVSKLLLDVNESASALRRFGEVGEGLVRIAVCGPQKEAMACTVAFMERNPDVRISFDVRHTQDNRHSVWSSDVVFAPMGTPFSPDVGVPYAMRRLNVVVPEGHKLAGESEVSLKRFENDPFVFITSPYEIYELSYSLCLDSGFSPIVRATTNSKPALLEFVRNGFCVGLLDGHTEKDGVSGVSMVTLATDSSIRALCFACRRPERLSPAARSYVDFMFEYFQVPDDQREMAIFDRD